MYEPIPSLGGRYEITPNGYVRNAKTKRLLKRVAGCVRVRQKGSRNVNRYSIDSLLFEVFGVIPLKRVFREPQGVTLIKGSEHYYLESIIKAAHFLAPRIHYSYSWTQKRMTKRYTKIEGWQIIYKQNRYKELIQ